MGAPTPQQAKTGLKTWHWILIGIAVVFFGLVMLGLIVGPKDEPAGTAATSTTSSAESSRENAPTPPTTSSSTPSDALAPTAAASTPAPAPTSTLAAAPDVATIAEQYVTDSLGGDPSSSSWGQYVTGYTYADGVLRVAMQTTDAETGEQASSAIANFIRLGSPPPELSEIDWIEAVDGTGTHLAQTAV